MVQTGIHNRGEYWFDKLKEKGFDQEVCEIGHGLILDKIYEPTGYPKPVRKFRMVRTGKDMKLEDMYYVILDHLRQDQGINDFIKVTDDFSSSVASSFFGNMQSRLAIQQDRAQGFMATVGKFVKDTFRMIHELRQLDQRLAVYEQWSKTLKETGKPSKAADNTLKALWTDFAEGGAKNPTSVIGLAQTVGYSYLPELFFNTMVTDVKKIDQVVDKLHVNTNVKNIAKRKFFQFLVWKEKTEAELTARRKFDLDYLLQHWEITRMYISWIKPYLQNAKSLSPSEGMRSNAEVVGSFDSTIAQVEFIARAPKMDGHYPVILCTFDYRSRPQSIYNQQYQNHTLIHTGRVEMNLRVYAWTSEQIDNYMALREEDELEVIGMLDNHLGQVMERLGDDFKDYIEEAKKAVGVKDKKKEAEEEAPKKKKRKPLKEALNDSMLGPFIDVGRGFYSLAESIIPMGAIFGEMMGKKESKKDGSTKAAEIKGSLVAMLTYEIYKKANRMLSW